jgi:hypothetical protein
MRSSPQSRSRFGTAGAFLQSRNPLSLIVLGFFGLSRFRLNAEVAATNSLSQAGQTVWPGFSLPTPQQRHFLIALSSKK